MAAALKVWTIVVHPHTRLIVAAKSRAEAHRALESVKAGVTMGYLTSHGSVTGNAAQVSVAMGKPGAVFKTHVMYGNNECDYDEVIDFRKFVALHNREERSSSMPHSITSETEIRNLIKEAKEAQKTMEPSPAPVEVPAPVHTVTLDGEQFNIRKDHYNRFQVYVVSPSGLERSIGRMTKYGSVKEAWDALFVSRMQD